MMLMMVVKQRTTIAGRTNICSRDEEAGGEPRVVQPVAPCGADGGRLGGGGGDEAVAVGVFSPLRRKDKVCDELSLLSVFMEYQHQCFLHGGTKKRLRREQNHFWFRTV